MKFPVEAEPVRQYIRDNVGRPKELPKPFWKNILLRWDEKCPLGLCPNAKGNMLKIPDNSQLTYPIMAKFIFWWDEQTDPQYAVDTVWGRE